MDQENRLPDGTLLNNSYRIERQLGEGGFGITYLAFDIFLEKRVAIKEFFPQVFCKRDSATSKMLVGTSKNELTVNRLKSKFLKEARNIARLNHPNIIKIFAAFEQNGTAYYVMELIDGCSLAEMVKFTCPLDESLAISYITRIGRALQYLHDNKIIHLDVKPGNIMVRKADGEPKLIDFGLSKQYDDNGQQTSSTPLGVSHGYAPMEQYHGGRMEVFSPESDIYSLAATFYYLVTGETPPHCDDIFNSGLSFPTSFPERLIPVITKAMSPRKQDRQRSVDEFLQTLSAAQEAVRFDTPLDNIKRDYKESEEQTDFDDDTEMTQGKEKGQEPKPENAPLPSEEKKSKKRLLPIIVSLILVCAIVLFAIMLIDGSNEANEGQIIEQEKEITDKPKAKYDADSISKLIAKYSDENIKSVTAADAEEIGALILSYINDKILFNRTHKETTDTVKLRNESEEFDKAHPYMKELDELYEKLVANNRVSSELQKEIAEGRKELEPNRIESPEPIEKEEPVKVEPEKVEPEKVEPEKKNIDNSTTTDSKDQSPKVSVPTEYCKELVEMAESGNLEAQNNLGFCYQHGEGIEPDFKKAVMWYRNAAKQGYAPAQYNLGFCYYYGVGVEKELKEAVIWFRKAAEQGDEKAQYNLGVCYYNGDGVNKDDAKAKYWLKEAARQGVNEAIDLLRRLGWD